MQRLGSQEAQSSLTMQLVWSNLVIIIINVSIVGLTLDGLLYL